MNLRISYAQNREDIIIGGFFPDVAQGHYVDVGAGHPSDLSVTKRFYDAGWDGINIEPIPELADLLRDERPRDLTLQVGVTAEAGTATLRHYAGSGLSSLNPDMIARYAQEPTDATAEFEDIEIEVVTLASILREHASAHIHFLKIDVEGSEYDVLVGNDWEAFRPELLCIETDHMVRDWTSLLADAQYHQVFHDGLNAYFLAEEARHRADHFTFADVVLAGAPIVGAEIAAEVTAAPELRAQVEALAQERSRILAEMADNEQQRLREEAEHQEERSRLDSALLAEIALRVAHVEREAALAAQLKEQGDYLATVLGSTSWRITKPIRKFTDFLRTRLPRRVVGELREIRDQRQADDVEVSPRQGALSPEGQQVLEDLDLLADEDRP